jgi:hypothetical protein
MERVAFKFERRMRSADRIAASAGRSYIGSTHNASRDEAGMGMVMELENPAKPPPGHRTPRMATNSTYSSKIVIGAPRSDIKHSIADMTS